MAKKYELTNDTIIHNGVTLYRIKRISDGKLGGFIQSEKNLSHGGEAWVSGKAKVSGNAKVFGNAKVYRNAWVFGNAKVSGKAKVYGDAQVYGDALVFEDARLSDDARVFGNAWVHSHAWVHGSAQVFGNAKVVGVLCSGFLTSPPQHKTTCDEKQPLTGNQNKNKQSLAEFWHPDSQFGFGADQTREISDFWNKYD